MINSLLGLMGPQLSHNGVPMEVCNGMEVCKGLYPDSKKWDQFREFGRSPQGLRLNNEKSGIFPT